MTGNGMIIPFLAGVKYRGKVYYAAHQSNGLFCFDPDTENSYFIAVFEKEDPGFFLYIRAFLYHNKMWLIPFHGKHIVCVNLDTFDMMYYPVPNRDIGKRAFYDGIRERNVLVLIPYHLDAVMMIDMNEGRCETLFQAPFLTGFWSRGGYIHGENIYVLKADGEIGLIINHVRKKVVLQSPEIKPPLFNMYAFRMGDELWITNFEGDSARRYILDDAGKMVLLDIINTQGVLAFRGIKSEDTVVLCPTGECREFIYYNCVSKEIQILGNFLPKKEIPAWFETNTIDSDEGVWVTTTTGILMDFSNPDDVMLYRTNASKDAASCAHEEWGRCGMYEQIYRGHIQIEGMALMDLSSFINDMLIVGGH